ncbi:phage tail assembly chaperone [Aquincola tertiaricarbonis]|uniref:phage tail assembly chaperone n=1 Tax=Aquincola tertiaricarbonis TaxID=391953 RepID=UPI000697932E|nr:phage tail assembly chaperone [Aquincola tertiaricarbonis]
MLKLIPNPTFKAKVQIPEPGGLEHQVTIEFKHHTRDEMDRLIESDAWKASGNEIANVMSIVVGWEGIDAPFNAESVALLVQHYQLAPAHIVEAFVRNQMGAKLGN